MRTLFSAYPVIGLILGLALLLWPWPFERRPREDYARRLAELEAGADERFFEEKRSLKAYPPLTTYGLRLAGAALAVLSLGMMIVRGQS